MAEHGLVGRDSELATIRERLSTGSRVLTLLGVAGTGKTSLLAATAEESAGTGWIVVRLQGRATETQLGFASLLDLLDAAAARGAEPLADTIRERVLGLDRSMTPEGLLLRREVHQWLLAVAAGRPLLVVVDDVQWVDVASWLVLAFVANRVAGTSVSFLLASRTEAAPVELHNHSVLHVPPLGRVHAAALVDRAAPRLDPVERAAIVEQAAGNPLALLELARVGGAAVPGEPSTPSAVPTAIEAAFAGDLPGLPEPTRRLLLLVAAGGDDLPLLARAVEGPRTVTQLLEPAEDAGLVSVRGKRVVFRHPLAQSTVYAVASASERREAHATLAELYAADADRRVWHRAAATDRPDEHVATELMASAERMHLRGAQQEAADAVVRAAELTVDPELRDDRVLRGIYLSAGIGNVHKQALLAAHFREHSTRPVVRAHSAQLHAYALAQTMQQRSAQDLLEVSLEELIKLDDEAGWSSLTTLASLTYQTCRRREVLAHWLERYEAITPHEMETHPLNAAARAWIKAALDPLERPAELRHLLHAAPELPPGEWPPYATSAFDMMLGATAWLLDEHPVALHRLARASDLMQRTGATQMLSQTVMALGQVHYDMGQYDDADRSGRLLVDLAEAHGLLYYRAVGRELRARVAAVRGDQQAAAGELHALLAETEPGQAVALEANLRVDLAQALTGLRDYEGAYRQLRMLFGPDGEPLHPHVSLRALADLVSAAVRVDRVEEVAPLVAVAERLLDDHPGQRMNRVLSRAKAQLAEDADGLHQRAVNEPGADVWPLEWAHAQLEYGVWLRRQHRPADARHHLGTAHETYARLGASSWAAAAEAELRAAGVRLESGEDDARWAELTAQEREIVLLAATGLSNKEIAQSLFLSPRTVSAHLYHAFPKLGVTARTQLRDVVDRLR